VPIFRAQGRTLTHAGEISVADDWAVIYGRVVKSPDLSEDCGPRGCGRFDVPILLITTSANTHVLKN
jgi:hypothetical protein